jgi:hypothetical protein
MILMMGVVEGCRANRDQKRADDRRSGQKNEAAFPWQRHGGKGISIAHNSPVSSRKNQFSGLHASAKFP